MKRHLLLALLFLPLSYGFAQKGDQTKYVVVNYDDTLKIPPLDRRHVYLNDIPPRYQWEHNSGYCGEVSLISAGLYYGQYLSQYDVRKMICGKVKQDTCEMLLGINDSMAAQALRLRHERKITKDSHEFLTWVKQHVIQGHPVIIGVMNNEYLLYRSTKANAGQPDYDHIVPVVGIGSEKPFSDPGYDANDVILFSDNGLITLNGDNPAKPKKGNAPYYFHYQFGSFQGSREQANRRNGPAYTLIELPKYAHRDEIYNYGIALLGVEGDEETLPVRISTNFNYEAPAIGHDSTKRPNPMPLKLTVKVSRLSPGVKYYLYQYDNEMDVPRSDFNKNSIHYKEKIEFTLSTGTEFLMELDIMSSEKVFFRCVKADK